MDKCEHLINHGGGKDFFAGCSALGEFTNLSVSESLQGFKKPTEQLHGRRMYWGNYLQSHHFLVTLSSKKVSQPQSCLGMLKK